MPGKESSCVKCITIDFLLLFVLPVVVFIVNLMFGSEPAPSQRPHEDARKFVEDFEAEFGNEHPHFMITSYDEVCVRACVYLIYT